MLAAISGRGEVQQPMAGVRYSIQFTPEEREQLNRLIRGGKPSARIVTRARILLKIDEGWKAPQVASALDVAEGTVYRVRRHC
ncbi:MAG: helix-turn-helix domain-containing protein [Dehalococcoidia bacterium]|nr:helix-turn-helix domain-containing protein [Dehalococcoidia bacterium]